MIADYKKQLISLRNKNKNFLKVTLPISSGAFSSFFWIGFKV